MIPYLKRRLNRKQKEMNEYITNFSCGRKWDWGYCGQDWKFKDKRCKLPKELCYGCKGKIYSTPQYIKLREEIKLLKELDVNAVNEDNSKSEIKPEIKLVDESDKNCKEMLERKLTHKIVWEDNSCNYFESEIKAKEYLEYDKNKRKSI